MMASLSAIAYRMDRVTPRYLKRMHGLELRHSSLACERVAFQKADEDEALSQGDGMTPAVDVIEQAHPEVAQAPTLGEAEFAAESAASVVDEVGRLEGYGTWRPYVARSNRRLRAPVQGSSVHQPSTLDVVPPTGVVAASVQRSRSAPDVRGAATHDDVARSRGLVEDALDAATVCAMQCDLRVHAEAASSSFESDDSDCDAVSAAARRVEPRRRAHGAHGALPMEDVLEGLEDGMEGDLMGAALRSIYDDREAECSSLGRWGLMEDVRRRIIAATTVRTVTATAAAGVRRDGKRRPAKPPRVAKPEVRDADGHHCPVHWLVADDTRSHIRYFSLQGSDSIESWRTNLAFDPVDFEDPALGVQVHRGMYEAALAAYSRFVPMVQEHLATSPFARVSFTGHSLGGSIAVILALMLVHRKVLRPMQLVPVYTFGAAAMFCEGPNCLACSSHCDVDDTFELEAHQPSTYIVGGLLRRLGVPVDSVRNVILTNDIVPRAFACDYSNVAKLLRHLSPFTSHGGLQCDERSIMYNFVGRIVVLQPASSISWVHGEEEANHPLLPHGPGLYELCEPHTRRGASPTVQVLDSMDSYLHHDEDAPVDVLHGFMATGAPHPARRPPAAAAASNGGAIEGYSTADDLDALQAHKRVAFFQSVLGGAGSHAACRVAAPPAAAAASSGQVTVDLGVLGTSLDLLEYAEAAAAEDAPPQSPRRSRQRKSSKAARAASLHHATLALFDTPHPLVILGSQSAYGESGIVSRFHHPDHYTQALGSVLRSNLAPMRMLSRSMGPDRVIAAMRAGLAKAQSANSAAHRRFSWGLEAIAAYRVRKTLHLGPEATLFGAASGLAGLWGKRPSSQRASADD